MANELKVSWSTIAALTVTNLASVADGNLWQSGEQNDSNPSYEYLEIFYEIVFNATPVAGDLLRFFLAKGDQDATSEIWDGGIGTSEGAITTAASIVAVEQGCMQVHAHAWATNHGTTFRGHFTMPARVWAPSWQVLVMPDGEALAASGHSVRYRYGVPQYQTS